MLHIFIKLITWKKYPHSRFFSSQFLYLNYKASKESLCKKMSLITQLLILRIILKIVKKYNPLIEYNESKYKKN